MCCPWICKKETKEKVHNAIEFSKLFGSTIDLVSVLTTDDEFIVNKLKRQMHQVHEYILEQNIPVPLSSSTATMWRKR